MIEAGEVTLNMTLLIICYIYIFLTIVIAVKIGHRLPKNARRKFLHIMIGNFVYIIPFFTFTTFPVNFPFFVAFPFIPLTLFASPSSPIKFKKQIGGLSEITSSGHNFGLVLYAISYTILALFFSSNPYVIIAGVLPMAFGDAAASIIGQRNGRHGLRWISNKSYEGSAAMFLTTFISVALSLLLFSYLYPFSTTTLLVSSFGVAVVSTILEAVTPKGLDNITVPLISAVTFLLLIGGI
jgi:dolichol kinase